MKNVERFFATLKGKFNRSRMNYLLHLLEEFELCVIPSSMLEDITNKALSSMELSVKGADSVTDLQCTLAYSLSLIHKLGIENLSSKDRKKLKDLLETTLLNETDLSISAKKVCSFG